MVLSAFAVRGTIPEKDPVELALTITAGSAPLVMVTCENGSVVPLMLISEAWMSVGTGSRMILGAIESCVIVTMPELLFWASSVTIIVRIFSAFQTSDVGTSKFPDISESPLPTIAPVVL